MLRIFIMAFLAMAALPSAAQDQPAPQEVELSHDNLDAPLVDEQTGRKYEIWLSYSPAEQFQTLGGQPYCKQRIRIINKSPYLLKNLEARFEWPGWRTPVRFFNFRPEQSNSILYRLPGPVCGGMYAAPRITVSVCSMESVYFETCVQMIRVKKWGEF